MENWVSRQVQSYVHYQSLSEAARTLAIANGYAQGSATHNAIAHALTSSGIAYDHSSLGASVLGDLREGNTTSGYYRDYNAGLNPPDYRWDTYKDLYNNQVGREIAEYAKQHNLSRSALNDLVIDALNNGKFIITRNDERIPPNFSGWPGDFDQGRIGMPPIWTGPSPAWQGSSGGGGVTDNPAEFNPPVPNQPAPFGKAHPSPFQKRDPLVVDMDGNGVQLVGVQNSTAHFDYGGTGFAPKTGWVAGGDGLLVRDIDHNTAITANELFGAVSGNAFADLRAYDGNGDGKINASDAVFADLKIWIDADSDGQGDAGELLSLATAGIVAINLNSQQSGQNVNGNVVVETATFVRADNTTGVIAEVNFATDSLYTQFTPPANFTLSPTAISLPSLVGYGNVPDLIFSMSMNPALETSVRNFVTQAGALSANDFRTAFENLMQSWAGVSGIDPASRGPLIDARHMALVEAFYGASYDQMNGTGATLNSFTANNIEATYQSIIDELTVRFVAQVPLSLMFDGASWEAVHGSPLFPFASIAFNQNTDAISVDFNRLVGDIVQGAPSDGAAQFSYYEKMAHLIRGLRVDLFNEDSVQLATAFQTAAASANLSADILALVTAEIQNNSMVGSAQNDTFRGRGGADYLEGRAGSDTYVWKQGDGNDEINDQSGSTTELDVLKLEDLNASDVTLKSSRTAPLPALEHHGRDHYGRLPI